MIEYFWLQTTFCGNGPLGMVEMELSPLRRMDRSPLCRYPTHLAMFCQRNHESVDALERSNGISIKGSDSKDPSSLDVSSGSREVNTELIANDLNLRKVSFLVYSRKK